MGGIASSAPSTTQRPVDPMYLLDLSLHSTTVETLVECDPTPKSPMEGGDLEAKLVLIDKEREACLAEQPKGEREHLREDISELRSMGDINDMTWETSPQTTQRSSDWDSKAFLNLEMTTNLLHVDLGGSSLSSHAMPFLPSAARTPD